MILGLLGCGLLGRLITNHPIGAYAGVATGWILGYLLLSFIRYHRGDFKHLLSFHQTSDFSKQFTEADIEYLKYRLKKEGLLRIWDDQNCFCFVDIECWEKLTNSEKTTFCRLLYESCIRMNGSEQGSRYCVKAYPSEDDYFTNEVSLWGDGELLNTFTPEKGLMSSEEFSDLANKQ